MPKVTQTVERVRTRAMEVGVYLPLGAYATVRDQITDLNGRRVRKLYDELVDRGQDRIAPVERVVRRRSEQVEDGAAEVAKEVRKTARKASSRATAAADTVAPKLPRVAAPKKASELPIKGYEDLTAAEIVSATKGLTQTELARVYKFERANENRSTVLEAVESRFVELPIPTYDALNVGEITERLEGLSPEELKVVRRYESETKARTTVLDKIDALLA
ncbi:MAG TPA: hypothetical protein VG318_11655 [Actinomycetota bacterium]|nr:hypothetical protein [Actinomycetota bacterium]